MPKQVLKILSILTVLFVLTRCAQVVPLTGGKRDVIPPKLLAANPPDKSTNFKGTQIVLQFNEFVKLKDLNNQFSISPKLKNTPDVQTDQKNVIVSFEADTLLPNTTYRLAFGNAIVDMNEGNALKKFEYVFSTGNFLDSLKVKGSVTDAFSNSPVAGVLVGLYIDRPELGDSLPYLEAPDYLSRGNENGEFVFTSLPHRGFKAYAIDDKNKDLLYEAETEKIGFQDEDLALKSDSTLSFKVFQEEASKSFIKKTLLPYTGLAQILLNKKQTVKVTALHAVDSASLFETRIGQEKDTVTLYYKNITDTLGLILSLSGKGDTILGKGDTLILPLAKRAPNRRKLKNYSINASSGALPLHSPLLVIFPNWMNILETQTTEMRLTSKEDSLINQQPVKGRWLDITRYEITNPLKENVSYRLKIDTCVFQDVNGICNDSNNFVFKTESRVEFGKVTLKVKFNKKQPYIVQLINDKGETISERQVSFSLSSSNAASLDFTDIKPGVYLVRIIYDDNNNHKWDTGRLLSKIQPEKVITHTKQIKVLSDWEIEEEILIKE